MSTTSDWRRPVLSAVWAIGGALILGDAVYALIDLENRTGSHDVRAYSAFVHKVIAALGAISLLQSVLFFVKGRLAVILSRAISVFVLGITGFWLLMMVVTGKIGSLVGATAFVFLFLGSLMSLAVKSNSRLSNPTKPAQPDGGA